MVVCQICGKGVQYGHNIRHSHSGQWEKRATKTRRIFLPNLHSGRVMIGGVVKNVRACASCLAKYRTKYTPNTHSRGARGTLSAIKTYF